MENNKMLIEQHPQLEGIINRITNLILAESIYFNRFQHREASFYELVVLIRNSSKLHITEAKPLLSILTPVYPTYKLRLFYAHEIREGLKNGSIVFYNICKPENLIYKLATSKFVLPMPGLTLKTMQTRTQRTFSKEMKKIVAFREGVRFYLSRKIMLWQLSCYTRQWNCATGWLN